jgi:hypothetical protein
MAAVRRSREMICRKTGNAQPQIYDAEEGAAFLRERGPFIPVWVITIINAFMLSPELQALGVDAGRTTDNVALRWVMRDGRSVRSVM